ncbi:ester cyclase [Kibdelosporangium persicum]|uniref:Ester cyclase n=1 Tax=Kibdelosporangium persicum TaxID=2698649 RepID=A0ABX2F1M1_9PSEU|nr:ester cyclase [Kibdelosporangium persicum]NRN65187.1 putative ester cyclase [Kibdelosporangium persicum]
MSYDRLARSWVDIWNGDLSLIDSTVHEDFVSHAAPMRGGPVADSVGRAGLAEWIGGIRAAVPDLRFTVQIGPLVDNPYLFMRWHAEGTYLGGIPGAADGPIPVDFHGTDILRITDRANGEGVITEYWLNADILWLTQQLGLQVGQVT